MPGRTDMCAVPISGGRPRRRGQAMVETLVALTAVLLAFFLVVQFADNLRAKLLVDYSAFRCARARTVGYHDYKLLKTARLGTLTASGPSRLKDDDGSGFSTGELLARMGCYLGASHDAQARSILDYDYWNDGVTEDPVSTLSGRRLTVEVRQHRPQFYTPWEAAGADGETRAEIVGRSEIEAHYPDYLQ